MKKTIFTLLFIVLVTYFSLLILQIGAIGFSCAQKIYNKKSDNFQQAQKPFEVTCGKEEYAQYQSWETMGPGLIRRSDVGWLLTPYVTGNPKGYLGPCRPYKKDENTFRIVLLGDSFTGAVQLSYEKTFAALIEKKLVTFHPGKKLEVINLGVGGYGTDQQYFTLIGEAVKYSPDLIIQNLFLGNDILDNSYSLYKYLEHPQHRDHPIKKYATLNQDNTLTWNKPDLQYYYEMNLAVFLGYDHPWEFNWNEQSFCVFFNYDTGKKKLLAQVKKENGSAYDEIDDVRFDHENCKFLFHLKRENKNILVHSLSDVPGGKEMDTMIDEAKIRWKCDFSEKPQTQQVQKSSLLNTIMGMVEQTKNFLKLNPLKKFIMERSINNYALMSFFINYGLVLKQDIPHYFFLGIQEDYPLSYKIFLNSPDSDWIQAWNITFALIKKEKEFIENNLKIPFLITVIPSMETLYPDYWSLVKAAYPPLTEVSKQMDVLKPVREMNAFLQKEGIWHLDFYSLMNRHYSETQRKLYAREHAHFNEEGHALVAKAISEEVSRMNK